MELTEKNIDFRVGSTDSEIRRILGLVGVFLEDGMAKARFGWGSFFVRHY